MVKIGDMGLHKYLTEKILSSERWNKGNHSWVTHSGNLKTASDKHNIIFSLSLLNLCHFRANRIGHLSYIGKEFKG